MATNDMDVIRRLKDTLRTTGIGGRTVFIGALGLAPKGDVLSSSQTFVTAKHLEDVIGLEGNGDFRGSHSRFDTTAQRRISAPLDD